jgi:hypothetical protein
VRCYCYGVLNISHVLFNVTCHSKSQSHAPKKKQHVINSFLCLEGPAYATRLFTRPWSICQSPSMALFLNETLWVLVYSIANNTNLYFTTAASKPRCPPFIRYLEPKSCQYRTRSLCRMDRHGFCFFSRTFQCIRFGRQRL